MNLVLAQWFKDNNRNNEAKREIHWNSVVFSVNLRLMHHDKFKFWNIFITAFLENELFTT